MRLRIYTDIDPFACAFLRHATRKGLRPDGSVVLADVRSLPFHTLPSHAEIHLFAGIGGWALGLKLAGWPEGLGVWTFSCPCQPFSTSGLRRGFADERHLWPAVRDAVRLHRPAVLLGEQVASADGLAWLDEVAGDLEAEGYAVWPVGLGAGACGFPHRRQRLWLAAVDHAGLAGLGSIGRDRALEAPKFPATPPSGRILAGKDGSLRILDLGVRIMAHGTPAGRRYVGAAGAAVVPRVAAVVARATLETILEDVTPGE